MAARKKGAAAGETPIEALIHQNATRKNIPTIEQEELVADEEQGAGAMLYPRDPTLDPQLVWKGKDEQDRSDLAVPVVPIYIQETILPKALIEDLRARAARAGEAGDLEMVVQGAATKTGFVGKAPNGREVTVVFEEDVGAFSGPFMAGKRLRVLGATRDPEEGTVRLTRAAEVFHWP